MVKLGNYPDESYLYFYISLMITKKNSESFRRYFCYYCDPSEKMRVYKIRSDSVVQLGFMHSMWDLESNISS